MSRTSVPTHSGCRCVADSNTGFHEPCRVTRLRKPGWRHGPQGLQSVLSCTRSSRFPPKTRGSSPLIANDGARTHLRSQLRSYEPPGSRAGIAAECECPFPEISASGLSTLAMIESAVGVFSFEVRFRSDSPGDAMSHANAVTSANSGESGNPLSGNQKLAPGCNAVRCGRRLARRISAPWRSGIGPMRFPPRWRAG